MAALRHMTDIDLKVLGIPMVGCLHSIFLFIFQIMIFSLKFDELLAIHCPHLSNNYHVSIHNCERA
jgi:hypothetical protein